MAKIKLGERPQRFKKTVTFTLLDGSEGSIEVTYKYRTRTEYGAFVDDWRRQREAKSSEQLEAALRAHEAAVKEAAAAGREPPKIELLKQFELQTQVVDASADFILQIAEAWDLDVDFTPENVRELCDQLPMAAAAISDSYRAALTEVRLGN